MEWSPGFQLSVHGAVIPKKEEQGKCDSNCLYADVFLYRIPVEYMKLVFSNLCDSIDT